MSFDLKRDWETREFPASRVTSRRKPGRLSLAGCSPTEPASVSPAEEKPDSCRHLRQAESGGEFAFFLGLPKFTPAFGQDEFGASFQFVLRSEVPDGRVQPFVVVMLHITRDDSSGVGQRKGRLGPDALALEGLMEPLDFPVAFRVTGRGPDVSHPTEADELLEVPGDELGTVVGDDPEPRLGISARTGQADSRTESAATGKKG